MKYWWNGVDVEYRKTSDRDLSCGTLSTTNITWTYPGSNSDLRGERPATDRLSHGVTLLVCLKESAASLSKGVCK